MDKLEQPYKGLLEEIRAQAAMDVISAVTRLIQTQTVALQQLNRQR